MDSRPLGGGELFIEVAYEALAVGGSLTPDNFEILEARWVTPTDLPEGTQESHRQLINGTTT
ncbi:hypothetical protein [Streptomyces shenzhenensis]|uniref:hypothetical protein n=1 Tax=Streptomyces shenzhenensis TaxID=943815 RepID=UPI003F541D5B